MNNKCTKKVRGIIINDMGQILLLHSNRHNGYSIPGGTVEENETIRDTVIREVFEETGASIIPIKIVGKYYHTSKNFNYEGITFDSNRVEYFYFCKFKSFKDFIERGHMKKDVTESLIGAGAFDSCYNLTSVTIGDSVTTIGEGAFYYCESLIEIIIPDSVTSIGNPNLLNSLNICLICSLETLLSICIWVPILSINLTPSVFS